MKPAASATDIFQHLGVKRVINACGIYTDLGGSVLSPTVWRAVEQMNQSFVGMVALLEASGRRVAELMGAEAARVTPGASAAIALGTAACIAGMDGDKWERLPDTSGMKADILMQRGHRYKYTRCARMSGGRVVEAGDELGTTPEQLAAAITEDTAVMFFPAHLNGMHHTVPLETAVAIAHARGVPVLVDAAYLNYPTSLMRSFLQAGADLVCFSAKYYWGPNSGGFICGRKDLIDAVSGLDFTRYESGKYLTFGRPMKMDRHIIAATVVALEEWFSMDHAARLQSYREKTDVLHAAVDGLPGITAKPMYFTMDERLAPEPVTCLAIEFSTTSPHTAEAISARLMECDPAIATVSLDGTLVVAVDTLLDGQEHEIARELARLLRA